MTIQQARVVVGRQIGLPESFDGTVAAYRELSAAQQTSLTGQMIRYIYNNPGQFTTAQVATATAEIGRADTLANIQDTSFDYEEFWTELGDEAYQTLGAPLQTIGDSVSDTLGIFGKAIPFIAIAVVVIIALPYLKKPVIS